MKTLLKKIAGFLCFFTAFYILVMFVTVYSTRFSSKLENKLFVNPQAGGGNYYRLPDAEKWFKNTAVTTPRGLLIGSSTVYRNVNPYTLSERTGIDFFNYGSSSQNLEASYILLKDILSKHSNIDYLFLDVSPMLWDVNIDGAAIDWAVNNKVPLTQVPFQYVMRCSSLKVKRLYLYNIVKRSLPIGKDHMQPGVYTDYYGKGWVKVNDNIPRENVDTMKFSNMNIPNKKGLLGILNLAKEHSIKLFVYISYPVKAQVDERVIADIVPSYFTSIGSGLADTMFYDSHHMYESGTVVNTEWIAQYINNHK